MTLLGVRPPPRRRIPREWLGPALTWLLRRLPGPRLFVSAAAILSIGAILTALADRPPSRLIWADEFEGPAGARPDPGKWTVETKDWGNGELQAYTRRPVNASLDGEGHLAVTARPEWYTRRDRTYRYTSARLNTLDKLEFTYGRIEARIRIPSGRGLHPAFWAVGADLRSTGWPASGEIDIMETHGSEVSTLFGTLHGPRRGHKDYSLGSKRRSAVPLSDGFHVYGVDWSVNRIAFSFDGKVYAVRTPSDMPRGSRWSFDHPFFLLISLAVGGEWAGEPDAKTPWPATMLVDWVRVWSRPETFCPTMHASRLRPPCPKRGRVGKGGGSSDEGHPPLRRGGGPRPKAGLR